MARQTDSSIPPSIAGLGICLLLAWPGTGVAQPIGTVRVADGLAAPSYVVSPPEDFNRLFIVEAFAGRIRILDLTTGIVGPAPFLTVPVDGEGLQGLAFHPSYGENGYFYVYYYRSFPERTVVERFTRDAADPDLADPASGRVIIEIPQPATNHNGGWIGFGRDGYLYLPLGDGGGGCDPWNNGQDTATLLSGLLRLDVDQDGFPGDAGRNYAIPADNPFVGVKGEDEIWSYGLRNPFRSSFDRLTGDLYIADVGQSTREEINYQPAASPGGENWGWKLREGFVASPCLAGQIPPDNADPIYDYSHGAGTNQGNSVTGGYVYRGPGASLQGKYFFGDYESERIWSIDAVTGGGFEDWTDTFVPDVGTIDQIVGFGEDGAGYLYIVDLGGELFRVVGPFPFVPCPDLLLSVDAVMGTEIIEHCRNIAVGPQYEVGPGGDLTLRAGNRVGLLDGTSVAADAELTIEIDTGLHLTPP